LWHGAAWHFALWGALHGAALAVERAVQVHRFAEALSARVAMLRALLMFNLVTLFWIPFRADSLENAVVMLSRMVGPATPCCVQLTNGMALAAALVAAAWAWQVITDRVDLRSRYLGWPVPVKSLVYSGVALAVFVMTSEAPKSFIYFKF
jgi:alginate O-acetyltransferase complex protein AlgI